MTIEEYRRDLCGLPSIPYWKNKGITLPDSMKIVHDRDFDERLLTDYTDSRYFRLKHDLKDIPECDNVISPERTYPDADFTAATCGT